MEDLWLGLSGIFIKMLFCSTEPHGAGEGEELLLLCVCVLKPRIPRVVNFSHEWSTFLGGVIYYKERKKRKTVKSKNLNNCMGGVIVVKNLL